ncbi:MAG TPA: hypothetical protein VGX68_08800 [Thermoanaerobaculia bacterium]|jgi:hypothetical protein|nr:hypothetical protein [Thermoanaerobaculia bacterium]
MAELRSPKVCAALVMIGWLASLIAFWGMTVAGRDAVAGDKSCGAKDLQSRGVRLEMAATAPKALDVLNHEPAKAACIRRGAAAQVKADYLFIPAYSLLALSLFLFVRALREELSGRMSVLQKVLPAAGVLLVLAMLIGDVVENLHLTEVIRFAGLKPPEEAGIAGQLPALRAASSVKFAALALSAGLLGVLWSSKTGSALVWVPRLIGLAAAAVFLYGLIRGEWEPVSWGMTVFAALGLAALIHAVAVATDPEQVLASEPLPGGQIS